MERHHPAGARGRPDEILDAFAHLRGGLVREGDREDLGRLRPDRGEQMGDAAREHARLSGARAGDHEERPFGGQHGLPLGRIQVFEVRLRRRRGHRSRIAAGYLASADTSRGQTPVAVSVIESRRGAAAEIRPRRFEARGEAGAARGRYRADWRGGALVLKPLDRAPAEIAWQADVLGAIREDGFRVTRPVPRIVDGWTAWHTSRAATSPAAGSTSSP